ncbi:response regulator transcription factor [Maritimibacter sp. UBA3975]|uniref:winged helix-turn-helix domain-containing protein n=1 Tax=Maritimibacter sp. UBA3975 TaxID=1946833 RepID=UPI000C0A0086|nr:response regulator transcription factor [Maritimibacter sp. UBA3975]MAM63250.1 DNA-binding response regulator [Maritimibacter sp.]|tara:strand:+ start:21527 stop:22165 length:639 start_codon:yes stop_codon:yes gene_type:complete
MTGGDAHILLVDPQEEKRALLRTYLGRHGFLVSAARDVDHAARLLAGLDFDLILMEDVAEAQALCELTRAPVLWLVAAGETRSGEVLSKPFEPQALVDRVNQMLDRRPPPAETAPKVLRFGPFTYDIASGDLCEGEVRVRLTGTEVKLMRALTDRPGAPVTRAELADAVEADPASRAVDVQVTRLRRKLEPNPRMPKVLQTVRGTGYMLVTD